MAHHARAEARSRGDRVTARLVHGSVDAQGATAFAVDRAAVHAFAVERHGDIAAAVDGDQAAVGLQAGELLYRHARRPGERLAEILHARRDVVGEHAADDRLAKPGAGDRTRLIVRVIAGADDRGIPDAAGQLAGVAAGRSGGAEVAAGVERHRTDRAVVAFESLAQGRQAGPRREIALGHQ